MLDIDTVFPILTVFSNEEIPTGRYVRFKLLVPMPTGIYETPKSSKRPLEPIWVIWVWTGFAGELATLTVVGIVMLPLIVILELPRDTGNGLA